MRIAPEALPFLLASLVFLPVAWWAGGPPALPAGALPFLFVLFFFRDPRRTPPAGDGLVLAPADGRVVDVRVVPDARFPGGRARRISTFLSIFNVHVNRSPLAGSVAGVTYSRGRFRAAFHGKASEENERNRIDLDTDRGPVAVTQIAGAVARRIVCDVRPGGSVRLGSRLGLIRFGSRVDVFLPTSWPVQVERGDTVRCSLTVIATTGAGARAAPESSKELAHAGA